MKSQSHPEIALWTDKHTQTQRFLHFSVHDNIYTPKYFFQCPKPVIAAIHNACVGGGVDMVSACDIRYATQDAWFQIKVL